MPTTITPAGNPQYPTSLSAPADGDACGAASVDPLFQDLLDASYAAQLVTAFGIKRARAWSTNGTDIIVPPLGGHLITVTGAWTAVQHVVQTTLAAATLYGSALPNSTRLYLYSSWVAGTQGFVLNTTAPDAALQYGTGGTTLAYVTTILTDGSGVIIPFIDDRGRYRYTGGTAAALHVLTAGTASSFTDVSLGTTVPSFAHHAHFSAVASAATDTYDFRPKGGTASGWSSAYTSYTSSTALCTFSVDCPTLPSGVQYSCTLGTGTLNLYTRGFDY